MRRREYLVLAVIWFAMGLVNFITAQDDFGYAIAAVMGILMGFNLGIAATVEVEDEWP
jgi:hypothetical protein